MRNTVLTALVKWTSLNPQLLSNWYSFSSGESVTVVSSVLIEKLTLSCANWTIGCLISAAWDSGTDPVKIDEVGQVSKWIWYSSLE